MTDPAPPPGHTANVDAEAPVAEEGSAPPAPRASRGPWFILFILLVVLAGAGYYWVEFVHRAMLAELSEELAASARATGALSARIDASGDELAAVAGGSAALESTIGDLESAVSRLEAAQADLEGSVKALYAKDSRASLEWVLAETEYLVLAATQRLALEGDVGTAVAALEAADEVLRAAQHPDFIALREKLAADIAALEAIDQPDVEGLAIELAEAVTRVDGLPTKPIAQLDMSFSRMREADVAASDWRGIARAVWADVRSLVEIKDGELEDGVLFDPELRYFLQQNLRLELASARLAVLRRDTENFRAACRLVIDLLDTYYDVAAAPVSAMRARLEDALGIELAPELPGIAGSLEAVRAQRDALRDAALAGG